MRGLLSFFYSLAAYAACLASLSYFVLFSANLVVPRSVDLGPGASWLEALGIDIGLLALFGIQHSAMARHGFKRWWTRAVPPALERSTYVVATCAVLALLFRFWLPIDTPVLWRVGGRVGVALLWALFGLGWVLVLVSTFLIDHFELFGLRQVLAALRRRTLPEQRFRTPLLYRYVRHPLYTGLILGLWSAPTMTAGHLLFASALSAYIVIGIAFEERDLMAVFGNRYGLYRAQVGMLLPRRATPVAALAISAAILLACVAQVVDETPPARSPGVERTPAPTISAIPAPRSEPQTPAEDPLSLQPVMF